MPSLDLTFHALSDPTRRRILSQLAESETTISDLAKPYKMSLQAVSKHLGVLRRAGLIQQRQQGRVRTCRLVARPLEDATRWLVEYHRFWSDQLDSLASFLEAESDNSNPMP